MNAHIKAMLKSMDKGNGRPPRAKYKVGQMLYFVRHGEVEMGIVTSVNKGDAKYWFRTPFYNLIVNREYGTSVGEANASPDPDVVMFQEVERLSKLFSDWTVKRYSKDFLAGLKIRAVALRAIVNEKEQGKVKNGGRNK